MGRQPHGRRADFPLTDSLRAFAALGVLAVHAIAASAALADDPGVTRYIARLDVAVPIFFTLSGFLLYRPFVRANLAGAACPSIADYGWRRFLRIAPGYWVALTIVGLWIGLSEVFTPPGILTYYGFAQIYGSESFGGGLVQAWTIGVEVAFYAFLPVYALAMRQLLRRARPESRLRGEVAGVALLFGIGITYNVAALASLGPIGYGFGPILNAFPAFLNQFALGMALAIWSVRVEERRSRGAGAGAAVSWIERWPGIPMAVALAGFLLLVHVIALEEGPLTDAEWLERHVMNTVVAGALLVPTVFGDPRRGLVRRVLANRFAIWLGTVSYGLYLYHVAVLWQLQQWGLRDVLGVSVASYAVWVALATAGAALLGAISWYALERPSLGQIRRFRAWRARRRSVMPQPVVPEPVVPEPAATAAVPER